MAVRRSAGVLLHMAILGLGFTQFIGGWAYFYGGESHLPLIAISVVFGRLNIDLEVPMGRDDIYRTMGSFSEDPPMTTDREEVITEGAHAARDGDMGRLGVDVSAISALLLHRSTENARAV